MRSIIAFRLAVIALCGAVFSAASAQSPAPQPAAKIIDVSIHMQSDAAHFKAWSGGGTTLRRGLGFIAPFGAAEYYCGRDFPEAKTAPFGDDQKALSRALANGPGGLFCIYLTKDGAIYAYDLPVGTILQGPDGFSAQVVNLVVGGTGAFQGASGVWLGRAEGRGAMMDVGNNLKLNDVLLKTMDGYLKVPQLGN